MSSRFFSEVSIFIQSMFEPTELLQQKFIYECGVGHTTFVKLCFDCFDSINKSNICFKGAMSNGHVDVVDVLLKNVQDVQDKLEFLLNETNLFKIPFCYQDLNIGKNVLKANSFENFFLFVVIYNNKFDIVDRFLQNVQNPKNEYSSENPLLFVDRVFQDLNFCVDPSVYNNYAIRFASEQGYIHIVDRLLQESRSRVDPSAQNNYAIRFASKNGHLDVVDRLLQEQCVDPSADDNFAIRCASKYGHLAVVERLLREPRSRVNPSAKDNFAIFHASLNNCVDVVYRLKFDLELNGSLDDNAEDIENAIRTLNNTAKYEKETKQKVKPTLFGYFCSWFD